jgi:hypothetical protein
MRLMEIPRFPRKIEITDINHFLRIRLSQTIVMWPDQAIPLLGYMCFPNNKEKREDLIQTLRSWATETEPDRAVIPCNLGRIQHEWLRVADIVHLHWDLIAGEHQSRRGGPSIGKAITLAQANIHGRGASAASLWQYWSAYKDAAPLIAAASLICAEARTRYREKTFGPFGLAADQLLPFQMALLIPDLVLAVTLEFERVGLSVVPGGCSEPALDRRTLWCIPTGINVMPVAPPARIIRTEDIRALNNRRAGNRGKANRKIA